MKQIRICHVVFAFDRIGGLENGLINILNHSDPLRFHHTICALTQCGEIQHRVFNKTVEYVSLNKNDGNDLCIPFLLSKEFKKHRIDLVHLRNWPTMVEGFIAAKLAGVRPIIYSEHGRHFEEIQTGGMLKFRVKQFIFNTVPVLLTVSTEVGKEMKSLYRLNRQIHVIRNGVDSFRFRSMPKDSVRKACCLGVDIPVIGTVSRLVKGKNLSELIDAFSNDSCWAKLLIIGGGPERELLENLIKDRGCDGRVLLLGNRTDIPELLNCLDVFLQPSESEGLSNVVIEAMACALPVVAFDIGGNRELVDHEKGGYLVSLNKMGTLLSRAKELILNKELALNMGQYNQEKITREFSIDQMVKAYTNMYVELTGGHRNDF